MCVCVCIYVCIYYISVQMHFMFTLFLYVCFKPKYSCHRVIGWTRGRPGGSGLFVLLIRRSLL